MSALGHKQTYAVQKAMSALPPIATAKATSRNAAMSGVSHLRSISTGDHWIQGI
jgi:hypothetical protein